MMQLVVGCHKLVAKNNKMKGALCALLLSILTLAQVAYAEEPSFPKRSDGEVFVEMGINEGNNIIMAKESMVIDASRTDLRDEFTSKITATYSLENAMPENTTSLIAIAKCMKVKKIQVDTRKVKKYKSGETIKVNNRIIDGFIYPVATRKKINANSAYEDATEALAHVNYLSYYNEAFKMYGSIEKNRYSPTTDYYIPDENGDEMVCVVVYELGFTPLESKEVVVENTIKGRLNRPFAETRYGSTFSFTCVGENLSSFYTVKNIDIVYKFSENAELGFVKCDGPIYQMDTVYTQRYKSGYKNFTYTVGHELSEDEINEVWANYGSGRRFIDILQIVGTTIIALSAMYLIFSVKKRRQSGIGSDTNNYFSC